MSEVIINDAIHGIMHFTTDIKENIKQIIDRKEFQRLRHIKQLGMCDLVFPSATHTRFNHCLGAAFIASEMSRKFKFDAKLTITTVVAALLHDIGHGPFSHIFEKLFFEDGRINHEEWTDEFIDDIKYNVDSKEIDWDLVKKIICSKYDKLSLKENESLASDIISSQLDCDRLDYLLRDSHFCGVPYGTHNLKWIINNLISIKTGDRYSLGIVKKGVPAVEDFLLCRRMMNYSIYSHPKVVACEYLLIEFLKSLLKENILETLSDNDIINGNIYHFLKACKEYALKENKEKFIKENYRYYKEIFDADIWFLIRNLANTNNLDIKKLVSYKIAIRFQTRKLPKGIRIKDQFREDINLMVKKIHGELPKEGKWLISFQEKSADIYKSKKNTLFVVKDSENKDFIRPIECEAPILSQVADKKDGGWILIYDKDDLSDKHNEDITKILDKCY